MKPNNPMAQLQQWKANNETKIGLVNQSKTGSVKNSAPLKFENNPKTQQEAQNATKAKRRVNVLPNPISFKLSQFSRQFELIKQANARCKENFPDCFHHKRKLAAELNELAEILHDGQALIQQHKAAMSAEEKAQAKRFNQAVDYLTFHFNAVCEDVAVLDNGGKNE